MAVFNRFRTTAVAKPQFDDDEEELKAIAQAKLAPAAAPKPVAPAAPVGFAKPPVAVPKPAPVQVAAKEKVAAAAPPPAPLGADKLLNQRESNGQRKKEDFALYGEVPFQDKKATDFGVSTIPKNDLGSDKLLNQGRRSNGERKKEDYALYGEVPFQDKKENDFGVSSIPEGKDFGVDELLDEERGDKEDSVRDNAVDEAKEESKRRRESGEKYDPRSDRDKAIDEGKRRIGERDDGDGELEQIARDRLSEQDATRAELAAGKAKALMMANARAQLAGMGLSGATAQLEGDIGRTQDRTAALTMAEVGRKQRDEGRQDRGLDIDERRADSAEKRADADAEFTKMQRKIAINMLEEDTGQDQDGDNLIGGKTQEYLDRMEYLGKKLGTEESGGDQPDSPTNGPRIEGHFGHTIAANGRLKMPAGSEDEMAAAETVQTVNPVTDQYAGSDNDFDYFVRPDGTLAKVPS